MEIMSDHNLLYETETVLYVAEMCIDTELWLHAMNGLSVSSSLACNN